MMADPLELQLSLFMHRNKHKPLFVMIIVTS